MRTHPTPKNKIAPAAFAVLALCPVAPCFADAAASFERGSRAQEAEDWYGASEFFLEAVSENPAYAQAWLRLAQCAWHQGQTDMALSYLDSAEKYDKDNAEARDLRGMCLAAQGKTDEARRIFNAVIASRPNDTQARFGLAELEILEGRTGGAEIQYAEALKRDPSNRKALLCMAFVALKAGKDDAARSYMREALRLHSSDAQTHFLSATLSAMQGRLREAETRARAALEIDGGRDEYYALLSSILYAQKKYDEAIDFCDFRIGRDRSAHLAWYLKGLSQEKLGDEEAAIKTWSAGLSIEGGDEIMRAALERAVARSVALEDARRPAWAAYHVAQAKECAKRYDSAGESCEWQSALKINPSDDEARMAYANMLDMNGLHELCLEQLKFIKKNKDESADETRGAPSASLDDKIEAYESLLADSLAKKWNAKPFYLDKIRWRIGIYCEPSGAQAIHADNAETTAAALASMFSGVAVTSVDARSAPAQGWGEAYRKARKSGVDYFVTLKVDEGSRGLSIESEMYSAVTGALMKKSSFYSAGAGRYSSCLRRTKNSILESLPIRGKILDRSGNDLLVDVGRSEMSKDGAVFAVVKKGALKAAGASMALDWAKDDFLGTLTVTRTGEEISEGTLERSGFYDKVGAGDEVALVSLPKDESEAGDRANPASVIENAPLSDAAGETVAAEENKRMITASDLSDGGSSFMDLIRSIN